LEFEQGKTSFNVPDEPTVRQILRYDSVIESKAELELYERLWAGCCVIAQDWKSDKVELSADALDQKLSADALEIIKWASLAAFSYVLQIKKVPKN